MKKGIWAVLLTAMMGGASSGCDGCRYADVMYAGLDIVEFWVVNQNEAPYLIKETIDSLTVTDLVTNTPVQVFLSPQQPNGYSFFIQDHRYDRASFDALTKASYRVRFSYEEIDTIKFQFKLKTVECGGLDFDQLQISWDKQVLNDGSSRSTFYEVKR